jgi:hypothetical protein
MKLSRALIAVFVLGLALPAAADDKKDDPEGIANLSFHVIKDDNGKPVRNASVILHQVAKNGKQQKGGFQLKTDPEGKTASEGVPYGMLRVQVIAAGFQTFGEDYVINQPNMDISIRLKRPQEQLTIYDKPGSSAQKANDNPQQNPPK